MTLIVLFLQDKRFLQEIDKLHIKQQFIKITVLNWKEEPLKTVQGIAISGSVNLDGSSSMRRTATLSLFAEEKDNNLANIDHLFSINKKCIIELGITNTVPNYTFKVQKNDQIPTFQTINYKQKYGEIIWFPLGVYVMFNPSIAHSLTGVTISMNLKDKMCLLNGDLGGQIHSAVEFGFQDQAVDRNDLSIEKNPTLVYNIIKELVNHWGNEQLSKIIISEVPFQIKSVVKWIGTENVYIVTNLTNPQICYTEEQARAWCEQKGIQIETEQQFNANIKIFEPNYDIGFIYTDFTYPGELTCNAGETVTSVLDKIISVLGNYEYFYDVEGNFRFQEKQNYLNMTNTAYWTKEQQEDKKIGNLPTDVYEADAYRLSKPVYNFIHNEYTTAYNNSLNYNNIKNDFVVWGSYPTTNSNYRIPCRFHLAIDKKPSLNKHAVALYKDGFQVMRGAGCIIKINEETKQPEVDEQGNYIILSPSVGDQLFPQAEKKVDRGEVIEVKTVTSLDWREEIYYQMLESEKLGTDTNTETNNTYFQYYAELKSEFPKIYDLKEQKYKQDMEKHPDKIDYFLDFIDEDSELGQYSVSNIGRRAKIIGDNNQGINCVFEPVIPDIVYIDASQYTTEEYNALITKFINIKQYYTNIRHETSSLLATGGSLNSCFEKIKDLLYQYTHVNNTISITTLPIYYLEPNTRITVEDQPAGIYGDYIIQSISLPLDVSSTMNINAYKALQKI